MFDALSRLQEQLLDNQLAVMHAGHAWTASFDWFAPATPTEVGQTEAQLSSPLPQDYGRFLAELSNGAVLFRDREFGQWGFRFYGTTEIVSKQREWKRSLPVAWSDGILAFGELLGEANVLVFDTTRPTKDSLSCAVLEGNAYEGFEDWPVLSRSFHEWLDHLITAQGDKYWLWA